MNQRNKIRRILHARFDYQGSFNEVAQWLESRHMLNGDMWKLFVNQYRVRTDGETSVWRGEYWGKMMRGATTIYIYTQNEELYQVLTDSIEDMLTTQDELGRFSTYEVEKEFGNWDIWCRKYVMLGFQYYLDICRDEELKERIIKAVSDHADYLIEKIGPTKEGKREITESGFEKLKGINASSILEPMIRQYNLTGNQSYLDFSEYIVASGGTRDENIFQLALEGKKFPFEYEVTKAYEMMSCFEGLLELYRVTRNEDYFIATKNFVQLIAESDVTIIGSSGCHHEFLDNSTRTQTDPTIELLKNETCVTVTWMKLCLQMLYLTGDSKYADYVELSGYNALLGAANIKECLFDFKSRERYRDRFISNETDNEITDWGMPFDSYSPLLAGVRGGGIGGLQQMEGTTYYGCCACIGGVGIGLFVNSAIMRRNDGFTVQFYLSGTATLTNMLGEAVTFQIVTDYPKSATIKIVLKDTPKSEYSLYFRIPDWSHTNRVSINGEEIEADSGTYLTIKRCWKAGDTVELNFDMRAVVLHQDDYVAIKRGPIVLAGDEVFGNNLDTAIAPKEHEDGTIDITLITNEDFKSILCAEVPMKDGTYIKMCDYASAGKEWNNGKRIAAWLPYQDK